MLFDICQMLNEINRGYLPQKGTKGILNRKGTKGLEVLFYRISYVTGASRFGYNMGSSVSALGFSPRGRLTPQ
jgi:hypothetical protein